MKDCAIFSIYYRNYNYGGQLQAYAMCEAIKKIGYTSEQLSYVRDKSFAKHKVKVVLSKSAAEKKDLFRRYVNRFLVKAGIGAKYAHSILKKFDAFMNITPHSEVYGSQTIYKSSNHYNVFISGSDQVWNPDTCSDEWFFNFLPEKCPRIAYSASIGKEYFTTEEKKRLKPLIEKYSFIGVREDKAKEIIESFTNCKATVVLDPVMLLDVTEWKRFDKWDILRKNKYLCVYLVAYNKDIEKKALEYAKKLDMKAVFITDPRNVMNQNPKGYWIPFENGVGPEEFIALFLNADLIITNSFHGMALCINFSKDFYAYYSRKINDKNTLNSRIDTVLNTFKLKNRLTSTDESLTTEQLKKKIDYRMVSSILENKRNQCLLMLKNAINECGESLNE